MNTRLSSPAAALAVLFLLAGCAGGGSQDNPFSGSAERKEIKLSITNLDFNQATVYAITSGSRQRVGRVMGKKEEEFIIPMYSTSDFYLEIDILAGPRCRTERVTVQPGDHLELTIQTSNPYLMCWAR
jgi:hypothetical protein